MTSRPALVANLSAVETFRRCTAEDLLELVDAAVPVSIPPSWAFISEGTPADTGYVLLDGHARVFRGRREVAVVGSGEVVGEMAFVRNSLRQATVSSASPISALRVDYAALARLVAVNPRLRQAIDDVFAKHDSVAA